MASVYVDKVFDAMNFSNALVQWRVTGLLKEQTLNTRINTKYTRIKYKILNTRIYQFSYMNNCNYGNFTTIRRTILTTILAQTQKRAL